VEKAVNYVKDGFLWLVEWTAANPTAAVGLAIGAVVLALVVF